WPFRTDFLDSSSLLTEGSVITDYAPTAGNARRWAQDTNHAQLGDPAKAAAIMVDLAPKYDPPIPLPLGSDCVARIEDMLTEQRRELDQWKSVSSYPDHSGLLARNRAPFEDTPRVA